MARVELSVRARPHGTCFRASPPAAKRPCRVCGDAHGIKHRPQTMQTRASAIPGRAEGSRRSRDGPCLRVGAKVRRERLDPSARGGPRVDEARIVVSHPFGAVSRTASKLHKMRSNMHNDSAPQGRSAHGGPGVFPISHASARRVLAPRRCTVYRDVLHRVSVLVPIGETAGTCCIYYIFAHIFAACSAHIRHVFAHLCAYIRYVFVRHRS